MAQQNQNVTNESKQLPVVTFRMAGHGTVKLSVWVNEWTDPATGEIKQNESITLSKSFRPKGSDDWQERKVTLFPDDLDALQTLIATYQSNRQVRMEFPK